MVAVESSSRPILTGRRVRFLDSGQEKVGIVRLDEGVQLIIQEGTRPRAAAELHVRKRWNVRVEGGR